MSAPSITLQPSGSGEAPAHSPSIADGTDNTPQPHPYLQQHPGFQRLFRPGALTVSLIQPLETHPGKPAPDFPSHA